MTETADSGGPDGQEHHELLGQQKDVPAAEWRALLERAERDIAILQSSEARVAADDSLPELLVTKARSGVRVRVLLADPDSEIRQTPETAVERVAYLTGRARMVAELYRRLHHEHGLRVRLNPAPPYAAMYLVDDRALVTQHVAGASADEGLTYYLRQDGDTAGPVLSTYRRSFDAAWSDGRDIGADELAPPDEDGLAPPAEPPST